MLPESFAASFLPTRAHTVLGRRLRPFCLWHDFLLQVIDSPLVNNSPATVVDLELAVRICSAPPGEGLEVLEGRRQSLRDKLRMAALARHPERIQREADAFAAYLRDHCQFPDFWSKVEKGADEFGAPPVIGSVLAQLMRNGHTLEEAFAMAPGRAHWLCALWSRQEGADVRFQNLSQAQLDSLAEFKAEYQRRKMESGEKAPEVPAH